MVLERPHLLELLLDPPAALQGHLDQFRQLLPRELAVRVEQLDQPRDRLADGLHVAGVEVRAEREVAVDHLGEVVLAEFPQGLGQVIDHEPVVVREELDPHLGHFPAGHVVVDAVEERHVLPDHVGHRREQVRRPDHHLDGLVRVAEHGERGRARERVLPPCERPRLAVGLERRDDLLGHLLEVGHLVEGDGVPDADQPHLAGRHVVEQVGDGRRPGQQDGVGRKLLVGVALARPPRPELDEVVVGLAERQQADQEQQLQPPVEVRRLHARCCGSAGRSTRRS